MAERDYQTIHAIYRAVIDRFPDVVEKGKKNRYTSVNGHMSSFLSPAGELCLRLSKEDMAIYLEQHPGGPVMQYGSVMRGYVLASDALLGDPDLLAEWFARSWNHISSLKPK